LSETATTVRYRLDAGRSRFTVQAFASGLLSFLGHSPTFAVRDFTGAAEFEGGTARGLCLALTVRAGSLELVDPVRAADRAEIERTMRQEVLDVTAYPEVRYDAVCEAAETLAPGRYWVRLAGQLLLHGVTRAHAVDAGLVVFDDGVRLGGETALRLSDYRIRPVTALGGTIKLKDELKLAFDIAGLPEGL
jgi:polyisoprenoid-binding protein YceI